MIETTERSRIVDSLVDLFRGITAGEPIGARVQTYQNSVALVARNFIDIENLAPEEFPAVLVVPTGEVSYRPHLENTYEAEWILPIVLYVRDDNFEARRFSETFSQLESLYRDVIYALHSTAPGVPLTLGEGPNVGLELLGWQSSCYANDSLAWGTLNLLVRYLETPFGP